MSKNLEKLNGNQNDQQNGSKISGPQDYVRIQIGCVENEGCSEEEGTRG